MLKNSFFSIISYFKNTPELPRSTFYFVGLLFATLISTLFYPGFFSNDSFNQWGQVESGQLETWHPIIMTVIWKYMANAFGVGGFFILNQIMYWFGFAIFIDVCFKRKLLFYAVALFPPILTMSLDVWKDVANFVALLLSVSLFLSYLKCHKKILFLPIILLLIYASLVRINGLIPAVVLVFCGSYLLAKKKKMFLAVMFTFCFIFSVKLSSDLITNFYKPQISRPLASLLLWDIAGISHFSGQYIELPKEIPVRDEEKVKGWASHYLSENCSLCWTAGLVCETRSSTDDKKLLSIWMREIRNRPLAYLEHRLSLASSLFGIRLKIYYPYHGYESNIMASKKFHISNHARSIFDYWTSIYFVFEKSFLFHPFIWIIFETLILIKFAFSVLKKINLKVKQKIVCILSLSGLVNAFSLIVLAVAADYRYIIWTVLSGFIALCLSFSKASFD